MFLFAFIEPARFQDIRESAALSLIDLEVGAGVYQRDCMQVQCDDGLARWQPEPCNSNNFLPICRVSLIDMCESDSTCVNSDKFCGSITIQTQKLDFKFQEAETLIKSHIGTDVYKTPTYNVYWDSGAYVVKNTSFKGPPITKQIAKLVALNSRVLSCRFTKR